jgi:cell division protein FtsB
MCNYTVITHEVKTMFKKKVVQSFRKAKKDIAGMRASVNSVHYQHEQLKQSLNEWVQYLYRENQALKARVKRLEDDSLAAAKTYY